jgi:hypothetical protein
VSAAASRQFVSGRCGIHSLKQGRRSRLSLVGASRSTPRAGLQPVRFILAGGAQPVDASAKRLGVRRSSSTPSTRRCVDPACALSRHQAHRDAEHRGMPIMRSLPSARSAILINLFNLPGGDRPRVITSLLSDGHQRCIVAGVVDIASRVHRRIHTR